MIDRTTDKISSYAASLAYADLTPGAIHAVKRSLIDSMGCALAAFAAEPVKIARRLAARIHSDEPASLLGTRIKTSPEMAGFVNGIMVRYLDYSDDYLNKDGPHPSDNISAIMAACESRHANGRALVCGIAVAYEIVGQLVDHAEFKFKGWDYVTETSIGTAMGAGNVLGLSKDQMAHALALAIAPNIGLYQSRTGELSMWKGCAGPNAARNGLFAALLASEGMTGPNLVIEGVRGLWNQVTGPFDVGPFGGSAHPFKVERTFFKPRPIMYTVLLPVETALSLRSQIEIDKIDSIKIFLDRFSCMSSGGREKYDPHTRETADHSIPYLTAAALVDGEISDRTFTPERYRDPQILGLLQRVTMEEDAQYSREWPDPFNCRIEITERSGRTVSRHLTNPKGHPSNPMSDAELDQKFVSLTRGVLTPDEVKRVSHMLWNVEELDDVSAIFEAVQI